MKVRHLLFLSLLVVSCTRSEEDFGLKFSPLRSTKKNTIYDNVIDYINFVKNGNSRSTTAYSVNPYLNKNGDTIAYIINYNEGWDLLSNDRRTPMLLASSTEGTFNKAEIAKTDNFNSYLTDIEESLTTLKTIPETDSDVLGEGWNAFYVKNRSVADEDIVITKASAESTSPGENGYWVLLESETKTVSNVTSSRAITTNWYQDMKAYTPYKLNSKGVSVHCLVGCVAVAGGQYLYYLHNKNNNPRYMVNSGVYDSVNNKYVFTGNSEDVWENMTNPLYYYADLMMGYIAEEIDTDFGIEKSSANEQNLSNFINSNYGYNLSWHSYSSSSIVNTLKQEGAVIAVADGYNTETNENAAHAFLIDGYKQVETETTSTYGWVGEDNKGNDTNDKDEEGNITGYAFMTTQTTSNVTSTIYMNWGQILTSYNSVGFNVNASTWTMGEYNYDGNKFILY